MASCLECVPNFSEGRRPEVVAAIVGAMRRVKGACVLDSTMDGAHNRAVVTLAGEPEPLELALLAAAGVARNLIDLAYHTGEHPRIGALDVCPFVPLAETSMQVAVDTARRLASRMARDLDIPVFLFGEAAERDQRRNLADVRRPQFEGMRSGAIDPDRGPGRVHPTAGAVAVGARFFLIAFNVDLDTDDLDLARRIARRVRERGGGLPCVRALGFRRSDRSVQVSMNLVDFRVTGIRAAFDEVARLAREAGVSVRGSELVGLAPRDALDRRTCRHVRLPFEAEERWIETRLARWRGESGRSE